MMRSLLYVLLTLSALGIAGATVDAAELTSSTEAQSSEAKMPTGAEFSNGPDGGATVDQTPRRMPSGAEFSNGPTGIDQE
jgi:hypothetical protein